MSEPGADSAESGNDKWYFLIDENLDPEIAAELEDRGHRAAHILDILFEGADDFADILPYCRQHDAILVTNNVLDFNSTDLSREDHSGIVIVHNKNRPAEEIADELHRITEAYPDAATLRGFESADDWSTT
jgi:predicted nuclease of predicted toxin-antitoxin system